MKDKISIFWFRRDLRLNDNTGLFHSLNESSKVKNEVTPITSILIDTQSQFWTLKYKPNESISENLQQLNDLKKWGIDPSKIENCSIFIPQGTESITGTETTFSLQANQITHEEWCGLLGQEVYSPQGHILGRTLEHFQDREFSIEQMVSYIEVPVVVDEETVNHKLYHLIANQGIRENRKPSIADSVYLAYKGSLLDGSVFDEKTYPVWFDLASVIRGFRYGLQHYAPGNFMEEETGSISFTDYGQGLLIMPSGLGYYSQSQVTIPAYSPLIFEVSVYTTNQTDHDNDTILSIEEDVDGDGDPYNDDTDGDGIANMFDADDDGDGVLTINEYDVDEDGVPDDTDNDGIPDYLDNE